MKIANLSGKPEIFHTIQGEGRSAGLPCIFLRLSQCNLHCIWCDTDYTWNWEGTPFRHENDDKPGYKKFRKKDLIIDCGTREIAHMVSTYNCPNLVITGGEPLMQQKELTELLISLRETGQIRHAEIETNGTYTPDPKLDMLIDQYNVSVKLSNSKNPYALRIRPDAIRFFAENPRAYFKFVIENQQDLSEVDELISEFSIPAERIILMPLGTSVDALNERESWLANLCRDRGFFFSDRMHIRLFGNKRGV